jgi:hypothetical protein
MVMTNPTYGTKGIGKRKTTKQILKELESMEKHYNKLKKIRDKRRLL